MRPLSFSDRYWFVKLTMALALVAVVVVVLLSTKGCAQKPHTHDEGYVDPDKSTPATCTESGLNYIRCKGCGEQLRYENVAALGHNYVSKSDVTKEETCATEGIEKSWKECKNCGDIEKGSTKTTKIDPTGDHKYGTWTEINGTRIAPTCQKDGSYEEIRYCTTCPSNNRASETRPVTIPAEKHSYAGFEAVYYNDKFCIKATCTKNCGESNEVYYFTEQNGVTVTRDKDYAPCCKAPYTLEMKYDGKDVVEILAADEDPNVVPHTMYYAGKHIDVNELKASNGYIDYSKEAVQANVYLLDSWNENGIARGAYKCSTCEEHQCESCNGEKWIEVHLYNEEKDTTK